MFIEIQITACCLLTVKLLWKTDGGGGHFEASWNLHKDLLRALRSGTEPAPYRVSRL